MKRLDGITEEKIRQMVTQFYQCVENDDLLGPVFNAQIQPHEWPTHLDLMCDFWSSVLLTTGRYRGNPREVHTSFPEITPKHFDRWLDLFQTTLQDIFDDKTTAQILNRAQRMRVVLQDAIDAQPRLL